MEFSKAIKIRPTVEKKTFHEALGLKWLFSRFSVWHSNKTKKVASCLNKISALGFMNSVHGAFFNQIKTRRDRNINSIHTIQCEMLANFIPKNIYFAVILTKFWLTSHLFSNKCLRGILKQLIIITNHQIILSWTGWFKTNLTQIK